MTRRLALALSALLAVFSPAEAAPPRLVVVVVADQLRADLLQRYEGLFEAGESRGFLRFVAEGATYRRAVYRYATTFTGPGHALVLTGSYPYRNGVAGNYWYDRKLGKMAYCVQDLETEWAPVGVEKAKSISPRTLLGSTVGDELKLASPASKVASFAIKDRSAVFLGGHAADAAVWCDDQGTGRLVTSRYYGDALPKKIVALDGGAAGPALADRILAEFPEWRLLREPALYAARSGVAEDAPRFENRPIERAWPWAGSAFPHVFPKSKDDPLFPSRYFLLATSPFGDDLTLRAALALREEYALGEDDVPDVLAVSFSSPDYVGHAFGPDSWETMDELLRLDSKIAALFAALDAVPGLAGRYVIALTSDHGVASVPALSKSRGLDAGTVEFAAKGEHWKTINREMTRKLAPYAAGEERVWIGGFEEPSFALVPAALARAGVAETAARAALKEILLSGVVPGVLAAFTREDLERTGRPGDVLEAAMRRSYYPPRGGDVYVVMRPFWLEPRSFATTHGQPHAYDADVPLLLYGQGVRKGARFDECDVIDLAPTLSRLLGVNAPSQSEGRVLSEALE